MQFKENYKCILLRKLKHKCWFKVALYMNGSTFYEPTSQYGNLDTVFCQIVFIEMIGCIIT